MDSVYTTPPAPIPIPHRHPENEACPADVREDILNDFRAWLYELDDALLDQAREPASENAPDLYAFYAELSAMRRDAQLQAKANQALHNGLRELAGNVKHDSTEQLRTLRDATADMRRQIPQARREAQAALALELVSLCEAVKRCGEAVTTLRLPSLLWGKRKTKTIDALTTPLSLLADKAGDSLQRLGIRSVAAPGDPFDAQTMRAVQTTRPVNGNEGRVVSVLRQGYDLNGTLLQTAEVEVAEL